jgi:anti-anti-sigma regulatory factor
MPTTIKQIDDNENGKTVLKVEGEMLLDDALLLERIALGLESELGTRVLIDIADLDLFDSEAASILKRLDDRYGVEIAGMEIFLQTMVNDAERQRA